VNLPEPSRSPFADRQALAHLPQAPGVYVMFGAAGERLYVGKAKNLKNRLMHYYQCRLDAKTLRLLAQVVDLQVTMTNTEAEALLLEKNLVKEHQPKYNLMLKDDKSYPYLCLNIDHPYPRLFFHRQQGPQKAPGLLFGPYPNAKAVREALSQLQAIFRLRHCDDVFFKHRSRPCLQYHIGRCSAPCVNYISQTDYQQSVWGVQQCLSGKDQALIERLAQSMANASAEQHYEQAAIIRDQLFRLRALQARQYVVNQRGDTDVIGVAVSGLHSCVQIFFIRAGKLLSSRPFFPAQTVLLSEAELLEMFLLHHYGEEGEAISTHLPDSVIIKASPQQVQDLKELLLASGKPLNLQSPQRGDKWRWLSMATENAQQALAQCLKQPQQWRARCLALQEALGLPEMPQKIDCFDVSHTAGEATVAACVSVGPEGPQRSGYRHYPIEGLNPGDDYGALREGLTRHYLAAKRQELPLPDLLLIDGGKGQWGVAAKALAELQLDPLLLAVAKGPARKSGAETLYLSGSQAWALNPTSPAFHLIQQIRDEAHRYAVSQHRRRRDRRRLVSHLDEIPGVGEKRRQALLRHFGQVSQIAAASQAALAEVPGIGPHLAGIIYRAWHPEKTHL